MLVIKPRDQDDDFKVFLCVFGLGKFYCVAKANAVENCGKEKSSSIIELFFSVFFFFKSNLQRVSRYSKLISEHKPNIIKKS